MTKVSKSTPISQRDYSQITSVTGDNNEGRGPHKVIDRFQINHSGSASWRIHCSLFSQKLFTCIGIHLRTKHTTKQRYIDVPEKWKQKLTL